MVKRTSPPPPDRVTFGGRLYVAADSGAVTAFRPAQRSKPRQFIQAFANLVNRFRKPVDPKRTTEQGTAGSASPATAYQSLWPQRYERAQYISDCRTLAFNDTRVRKSTRKFAAEAVRGGIKIRVQGRDGLSKRSQAVADAAAKLMTPQKLASWAWMLLLEGDLFVQAVVTDDDELVKFVRMPAASMERLSDDADQIIDPARAFAQVDVTTWAEITTFPLALMSHVRWDHVDGDRYGTPEIIASRRPFHLLDLIETSQSTRRMARSSIARHWDLGVGAQAADVDKFKADNGMIEGARDPFDPMEVTRDYVSKGGATCNVIEGDPNVHEIDDIKYFQDVATAGLPAPKSVYGLDAESINRDILEDQRSEYLKDTNRVNEALDEVVRFGVDLALMLEGIDPDLVEYEVVWSRSTTEKESERVQSIIALRGAKLITKKTALTQIAQYVDLASVDDEMKELEAEIDADLDHEAERQERLAPDVPGDAPGKAKQSRPKA